jgi:hypothetical protein
MQTTTVDYIETNCPRCCGKGYIPQFQHMKGGECFSCGGTGRGLPKPVEREMNYAEICAVLAQHGFNIVRIETDNPDDWLKALFVPDEVIEGARMLLKAI